MRWMVSGASEADAAIYEPVPQLVPGSFKEIRVFRDRLVVVGESTGTSLLVLPIEFSHCLDVSIATGSGARVLRANINQTALLFSGRTLSITTTCHGPDTEVSPIHRTCLMYCSTPQWPPS